ncbi:MAG: 50S ribosomal protein L22 [bacterium]
MPVIAKLRELKIAPRKVRLVAELIRGKRTQEAQGLLRFTIKKGCLPILKLLDSAISNAKNNFGLNENNLYIAKIFVDEGHKQRKFRARARGTASFIKKRSSHVTIILETVKDLSQDSKLPVVAQEKAEKIVSEKVKKAQGKTKVAIRVSHMRKKNRMRTNNPGKIFRRKSI